MYHSSLISLYLCLQIVTGAFRVQGPLEPVVAMLGGNAELPCLLLPPQSVKNMKISWTRFLPSQVVHLYEDGRDKPEEAHEKYFGRTELVTDNMDKGVVTLRILNVQPSDSGQYRCAFQHGSFYSDAFIMLKMAVLGSRPQLHVEVTKSSQFQIECKSEGWFPQPKVQWMDSEGGEIPAEYETHTLDDGGLFHVTTTLLLREPPQKNLTCSIWNPVLNQKKEEQLSTEVAASNSTTLITMIIALATLIMLIILIPTGIYLYRIRLKNRKYLGVPCHSTNKTTTANTTTTAYALVPECNPVAASADALRADPAQGISAAHPDQKAASANASGTGQAEDINAVHPDQGAANTNTSGIAQAKGISAVHPDQDTANANASGTAQAKGISAVHPDQDTANANTSGTAQAEGINAASTNPSQAAPAKGFNAAQPDQGAASTNASGTAQAEGIDAANPDQDATIVNMSGAACIHMETPNDTYAADANAKHRLQSKYDIQKEAELRSWIEGLTGQSIGPDFQEGLKDGIILCTLMNKLQPGSVPKINQSTQNWHQLENLSNFNKAMASFGIDSMDRFEPNDLFERGSMTQVQVSLLALERKAKTNGLQCSMDSGIRYLEKQEQEHR